MREAILDELRRAGAPLAVADLATSAGGPSTTVRFHLRSLVEDGLVEVVTAPPEGPGRPRLLYRARAAMDPSGPRNYALLADVLVRALATVPDAESRAVAAGREWGERRARAAADPVDDLVSVLDDFGFAPETAESGDGIRLNRCPFLESATARPAVTCSVHRGIMQGVLGAHGPAVELVRLDAFVDGDHCLATLDVAAQEGSVRGHSPA